ncbi:MAG: TatD family hydrolase [Halanaeroarchaeum sp.]
MRDLGTPVLDDHLHLDPRHGRGIEAVKDFARSGGTHLLVVNKPSWLLGVNPQTGEDFRAVFEETMEVVERASGVLRGRAWPVLGVHPALVSKLIDDRGYDPEDAAGLMKAGLETAAEYADAGTAVAIKSGRPHYDVSAAVWDASNEVLRRALELGAETDVAVQLHTEETTDLTQVAGWAESVGLEPERVVKHYASGDVAGLTPSVMSQKDYLEIAVERRKPFLMETDFVDDPDRPGAVMGPKTVPRRVDWLQDRGEEDAIRTAHVETPEAIYGINTIGTLG